MSSSSSDAIRRASPTGSVASRSSQLRRCCPGSNAVDEDDYPEPCGGIRIVLTAPSVPLRSGETG